MVCSDFVILLLQCEFKIHLINDPGKFVPCFRGILVKLHEWPENFMEAFADRHDEGVVWMGFEKKFEMVHMNWCDYFEQMRVSFKSSECHCIM